MKKCRKIFVILCLVFMVWGLTRCESDAEVPSSSFEIVSLEQLPSAIQDKITVTTGVLKTSYANKNNDEAFGIGITDKIHRRQKENGATSYTLALTQTDEGLYYDNLVINEATDGSLNIHIIRYQPEASWFYKHKNEGWGYETYSGTITIYTETGHSVSSMDFVSGHPQKNHAKIAADSANKAGNCEIVDIQEAGLLQDGIFYVYEITIIVDCTGEGLGGGGFGDEGLNNDFGEEGGAGGPGGGNGNGAEPIDTVPVEVIGDIEFIGPDTPIANIADYLECFDPTQGASVTIYVDQPITDSDAIASTSDKAGHAFISISQNGNTSVFGFYPAGNAGIFNPSGASAMGNDSDRIYDVSISKNINGSTLQSILNHSINYPSSYNLNTYNCTDFVIEVGNLMGMELPDCYSNWGVGGGSNPGKLGQYIRNNFNADGTYIVNENGGNAPSNNKGC